MLGEVFSYRFAGPDPDHALLVMHGIASHGGIYDNFGAHYAAQGAEVWCMDAPGHGRSCISQRPGQWTFEQWVDAAVAYGDHITDTTGLPVIIKGSSLGAAAAYCAMAASETFPGSVLMGFMIPSSPMMKPTNVFRTEAFEKLSAIMGDKFVLHIERFFDFDTDYGYVGAAEQKKADPYNTWFYDMSSWGSLFRYDPAVPLAENTKPILFTVGENDPTFPPEVARRVTDATAGPVELYMEPQGKHQLMLFHTHQYTDVVTDWCRHLINGASS
ncbi:alpha/beta hydrolase [Candidatus Poriferisodalis sp.]|uniref:alpha/beta hydrolase n=1 Tax=Candidatus Poriferisodalis sp. TaxID=3101277 RepID=UPI003B0265D8